jgi:hypothetical protein
MPFLVSLAREDDMKHRVGRLTKRNRAKYRCRVSATAMFATSTNGALLWLLERGGGGSMDSAAAIGRRVGAAHDFDDSRAA